jgi:PAS domain S-box-containing protein
MNSELLELRAKAFDYLFDAVVVIDSQGIIIDWNKGSQDLYGFTKEEVISKHVSILHVPEDIGHITAEVIFALATY